MISFNILQNISDPANIRGLSSSSSTLCIIGRELALEFGNGSYRPKIAEHLPGVVNKVADELSRQHEPGMKFVLPYVLVGVPETVAPLRCVSWYKAFTPPTASITAKQMQKFKTKAIDPLTDDALREFERI